jgi:molybdopterin converting factor small subunit
MTLESGRSVAHVLSSLVNTDDRYTLLFDAASQTLPEHVEIVLNDRVLDLQGGLNAVLHNGDTLTFLPAHAGG